MARFSDGINPARLREAQAQTPTPPPLPPLPGGVLIVAGTISGEGVSVNEAYVNVPGRGRVASAALTRFKAAGKADLRLCRLHLPPRPQRHALDVTFYGRWESKAGDPLRKDCSNRIKSLEDLLAEWLGMDDKWVYEVRARKVHEPTAPRIEFTLTTL